MDIKLHISHLHLLNLQPRRVHQCQNHHITAWTHSAVTGNSLVQESQATKDEEGRSALHGICSGEPHCTHQPVLSSWPRQATMSRPRTRTSGTSYTFLAHWQPQVSAPTVFLFGFLPTFTAETKVTVCNDMSEERENSQEWT